MASGVMLFAITLTSDQLPCPIRIVNDCNPVVVNGWRHDPYRFEVLVNERGKFPHATVRVAPEAGGYTVLLARGESIVGEIAGHATIYLLSKPRPDAGAATVDWEESFAVVTRPESHHPWPADKVPAELFRPGGEGTT